MTDSLEHYKNTLELTVFRIGDFWVFDDIKSKVESEPLILGMPSIINAELSLLTGTPNHKMFSLFISNKPFPESPDDDIVLSFSHEEENGGWYWWNTAMLEGWLSPYFKEKFNFLFKENFPKTLFLRIKNVKDSYSIVI